MWRVWCVDVDVDSVRLLFFFWFDGGCGCGGCGGFRGGIGIIWIKVQALLEFEFKDKAKNEVVECRG